LESVAHHETWLTELQKGSYALVSDGLEVDTAVIFVHDFLGDAQGTWLNFQEMICSQGNEHPLWAKCDVFFFSYRSFRDDITESAGALLKFMRAIFPKPPSWVFEIPEQLKGFSSLLDLTKDIPTYRHLVLVGHSEGGIVIRRAEHGLALPDQERQLVSTMSNFWNWFHQTRLDPVGTTGGRTYTEGLCLRWDQIDLDHSVIYFGGKPKTEGSSGPVPLMGLAHDVLFRWKKEQGGKRPFHFPSAVKPDQPISTVKTACKTTLKHAGVAHFPIYHLRHVFCKHLNWVVPDAVVQRAMRHWSPETKRHYQLGMVEQVRQNLEKANEKVYGKGTVLRFYDGQPAARNDQEITASR
jgi:hypothetical protein